MSDCSERLRRAGFPYPRTCARCGLGPCAVPAAAEIDAPGPAYRDATDLAAQIAAKVFVHVVDRPRRDELAALLAAFAAEIKRSAIEP